VERLGSKKALSKIRENIRLSSQLLEQMKNVCITKDNHKRIVDGLGNPEGTLLPAGRQVLFVWNFPFSKTESFVLKPYQLTFEELILHCLSVEKFKAQFQDVLFSTNSDHVFVRVLDVVAVGIIETKSARIPFLIQEFSQGTRIQDMIVKNQQSPFLHLSSVFKQIAKEGFYLDPFPSNWLVIPPLDASSHYCLEYLDLIFKKELATLQKIEKFIENLGKLHVNA